jgi:hypothetical protein
MAEVTRSTAEASIRRLASERSAAAAVGLCEHCYAHTTARNPYGDGHSPNYCDGPGLEPKRFAGRQRRLKIEVNKEFMKELGNRNATARKFSNPYEEQWKDNIEANKEYMKRLGLEKRESGIFEVD